MITVSLSIDNAYPDGVVRTHVGGAVVPEPGSDLREWAVDNLYPFTGTDRPGCSAVYTVTITDSSDPALAGLTFEFN